MKGDVMNQIVGLKLIAVLSNLMLGQSLGSLITRCSDTKRYRVLIFLLLSIIVVLPLVIQWYVGGAEASSLRYLAIISVVLTAIAAFVVFVFPHIYKDAFEKTSKRNKALIEGILSFFSGLYASDMLKLFESLGIPSYVRSIISGVLVLLLVILALYVERKRRRNS